MSAAQSLDNRPRTSLPAWGLLLLIILVAVALRLWQLDRLPPGLFYDEAYNGMDARRVAEGGYLPRYFPGNNGREPLYLYLQALMITLLGPTAYALRLTSALIGIVTVPLTYFCALTLLAPDEKTRAQPDTLVWPALIAAAGMAVSFWPVSLSRLAFRAVLLPPLSLLAIAFFWRAWIGGRRRDWLWSGVCFGLALSTYIAARLLPVVIVLFVALELLIALLRRPAGWHQSWRRRAGGLAWLAGAGLLAALPLLSVWVQNPALIGARTGDVSIFSVSERDWPGTPGTRLLGNIRAVAGNFYHRGDLNLRHNLPNRPVNDWLLAALFTLGWLGAIWRLREAKMRLLLLWFGIMAIPSLLSTDAPHLLRMVGMLPPLALLYGVGAQAFLQLTDGWLRPQRAGAALLAIVLLVSGAWTARDYFVRWAGQPELGHAFDLDQQLAASWLARALAEEDVAFVTTRRLFLTPQVRFALGEVPMVALDADAARNATLLVEEAADPFQPRYLLQRTDDGLQAAWVALIGDMSAAGPVEDVVWPGANVGWPRLHVSPLPAGAALQPAAPRYPLDVTFVNGLQLVGYDLLPDSVATDADAAVRLATYWRLAPEQVAPPSEGYDLFAHLLLPDGAQVQENGNLGRGFPPELWQGEQIVDDRRLFDVPADAAAGKASFELGLFDPRVPEGAARLAIVDAGGAPVADRVLLGPIAVDVTPPQVLLDDLTQLDATFDTRIGLLGWRAAPAAEVPSTLVVELAWEALDRVTSDYTAFVHLLDVEGNIIAQFDRPPGGEANPTTHWLPGEQVRAAFPLADVLPLGDGYRLRIGLYEPVSGRQLPAAPAAGEPNATYVLLSLEAQP